MNSVMNAYMESESTNQTLSRAFRNIANALDCWSHTDLKRVLRIQELNRAQEICFILMASLRGSEDDAFNNAMTRILAKTNSDITQALMDKKVDFSEHVKSFLWMAESMK